MIPDLYNAWSEKPREFTWKGEEYKIDEHTEDPHGDHVMALKLNLLLFVY